MNDSTPPQSGADPRSPVGEAPGSNGSALTLDNLAGHYDINGDFVYFDWKAGGCTTHRKGFQLVRGFDIVRGIEAATIQRAFLDRAIADMLAVLGQGPTVSPSNGPNLPSQAGTQSV
jgi:hypothetical protein